MKLAVMKLTSLLVLMVGVLPIALMFTEVPYADQVGNILRNLAPTADAEIAITEKIVAIVVSVVLVILGFYGFIPSFGRNKGGRQLIIKGADGNITLSLDSVQVNLARELTKMPEVHKAKLHIDPIKGGKKAIVMADVEIEKLGGVSTREIANTISATLTRNAKEVLGLEDMVKVKLVIDGIHVDENQAQAQAAATAPQTRSEASSATEPEQPSATEAKVDAASSSPASPAPIVAAESESDASTFGGQEQADPLSSQATDADTAQDISWRESTLDTADTASKDDVNQPASNSEEESQAGDAHNDKEDKRHTW